MVCPQPHSSFTSSQLGDKIVQTTRQVHFVCGWRLAWVWAILAATAVGSVDANAADPPPQWIVVTAPAFQKAVEPLRRRRAAEGFQVTALATTDVLSKEEIERGDARKLNDAVHNLCRRAKGNTYVLLVGVTAAAAGQDAPATVLPPLTGTIGRMKGRPSDNGYGCLNGDLLPTVAVGRLPARTATEAQQMVEKILAFERDGQQAAWRRSITMLVGNPGVSTVAEQTIANWYISSTAGKVNPAWSLRTIYHIPNSAWFVPDEKLHDKALDYLQRGQAFTCYLGHSNDAGFWSNGARFLDRTDWAGMKVRHGAGVFVTCGCYSCQLDATGRQDHEGYGLAAIRNPAGPVAVAGAVGESYAAAGQLAFNGLLSDFSADKLSDRLGDLWLHLKGGIAKGPLDFMTFMAFDFADGSQGKVPLDVQRKEHNEMWILLGDPAMHLPAVASDFTLDVPQTAAAGSTIKVRGVLPAGMNAARRVRILVERPATGQPNGLEPVPDGPPDVRARAILANHERANNPVLLSQEVNVVDGRFDAQVELPKSLPWPRVVVRAVIAESKLNGMGVATVKIGLSPPAKRSKPGRS
jgi:hypothetical protein